MQGAGGGVVQPVGPNLPLSLPVQAVVKSDFVGSYADGTREFNPIVKRTGRGKYTHTKYNARLFKSGTSSNL